MTDTRIVQSAEARQNSPTISSYVLPGLSSTFSDCRILTKPEVNFLIALATFTGFYLGRAHRPEHFPLSLLVSTLLGTLLVASGTATLNQYLERRFAALMRRTARRPLAAGRLKASTGLRLGIALAGIGSVLLRNEDLARCRCDGSFYLAEAREWNGFFLILPDRLSQVLESGWFGALVIFANERTMAVTVVHNGTQRLLNACEQRPTDS